MGKLGKVVVLTFLISSLGMINLPSAFSHGVVDQNNTPGIFDLFVIIPSSPPEIGQTFTPTVPDIVALDIFLNGGDAGVLLDILINDNGGASVIFELDFNPGCPCVPSTPIHVDFTISQTTALSVGLTNNIRILHAPSSSGTPTNLVGTLVIDPYPPGSALGPGTVPGDDFDFVTYFLGSPPPPDIPLTMDLQAGCILTVNTITATFGTVSPPATGIATFSFQNDGTATLAVFADVGDSTTGGMQDSVPEVTILPQDMTVDAGTAFDPVPTATMLNTGFPVLIANLEPLSSANENNNPRVGTITAATNNLQNLPASGTLTGALTFTGGACGVVPAPAPAPNGGGFG